MIATDSETHLEAFTSI